MFAYLNWKNVSKIQFCGLSLIILILVELLGINNFANICSNSRHKLLSTYLMKHYIENRHFKKLFCQTKIYIHIFLIFCTFET